MQIFGKTITILPAAGAESAQIEARTDKYGDQFVVNVLPPQLTSALEGSTYVARATPVAGGTGIAMGVQTTYSDTANIPVLLQNGNATKTIIPLYIKGRCTAAGASTTAAEAAVEIDATNRFSSGGTLLTGVPTNTGGAASAGVCRVGAVAAGAAGGTRYWLWSEVIREAAAPTWIIDDTVVLVFGGLGEGVGYQAWNGPGLTVVRASGGSRFNFGLPAVALPPTATMLLHIANIGNSATPPSFEWEVAWIER